MGAGRAVEGRAGGCVVFVARPVAAALVVTVVGPLGVPVLVRFVVDEDGVGSRAHVARVAVRPHPPDLPPISAPSPRSCSRFLPEALRRRPAVVVAQVGAAAPAPLVLRWLPPLPSPLLEAQWAVGGRARPLALRVQAAE